MAKVLLLFAHPAFEKSKVNRALVHAARRVGGVTFHDLYENYPDFDVNVEVEQRLLESHDVILFQHPFYWYSTPALLKQWFDLVLEHGWAYGEGGTALSKKRMISVITTGGREPAYTPEGFHQITISELLAPIRQTARLCHMEYSRPYVIHGSFQLTPADLMRLGSEYATFLEALVEDRLDFEKTHSHPRLNDALVASIRSRDLSEVSRGEP
jgi:glutathione-regulated potassium-efflux system ancillary protein KefG